MMDYDLSQLDMQEGSLLNEHGFIDAHIFKQLREFWIPDVEFTLRLVKLIEAGFFP